MVIKKYLIFCYNIPINPTGKRASRVCKTQTSNRVSCIEAAFMTMLTCGLLV